MTIFEYEIHFCYLARHATTLIPTETERVRWFVRELTYHFPQSVFRMSRDGASSQSMVSAAKEAELMCKEKFGDPKKVHLSR